MNRALIERAQFDLCSSLSPLKSIAHFTPAGDARWAGVVDLPSTQQYELEIGFKYDLYMLRGAAEFDRVTIAGETFTTQCGGTVGVAKEGGARFFVYREKEGSDKCEAVVTTAQSRAWRDARAAYMRVAPLPNPRYQVSFVAWEPGARTRDHEHSAGEEIFVLTGELRSGGDQYPAGTWLRFYPGSHHEPFALVPTLILLRNGHLSNGESGSETG
jgi:hypothetical protein